MEKLRQILSTSSSSALKEVLCGLPRSFLHSVSLGQLTGQSLWACDQNCLVGLHAQQGLALGVECSVVWGLGILSNFYF